MLFNCNYNVKDLNISSLFYTQLLKWWTGVNFMKTMQLIITGIISSGIIRKLESITNQYFYKR